MTRSSFVPPSLPIFNKHENTNPLSSACSSVRSARTKRWYKNGGVLRTDQLLCGCISAGYTSQRLALRTYKKDRDIFDYNAMLKTCAHCVIRGAIDADAVVSIQSNLVPYMESPNGWCTSVQFSQQVFQKPILFKSYALADFGLRPGSSINNPPFLSIWLHGIVRISFPYFKFASLFLSRKIAKPPHGKMSLYFTRTCPSTGLATHPALIADRMPPLFFGSPLIELFH
jgi:hypothetical protein